MSSLKPGGPRIRLNQSDGPYQELAVRFRSPSNTSSYGSLDDARTPPGMACMAVSPPYGASQSGSLDDERDAQVKVVSQCRGHTPLDEMGVNPRKQQVIRLVSRCRGMPYGTQAGILLDEEDDDDQLPVEAPPGIRVIARCTENSGSYSYREDEARATAERSGRYRERVPAYPRGRHAGAAPEPSSDSGVPAIAHIMGECAHFQELSDTTELSYEDEYGSCKVCVQRMRDKSTEGAPPPRMARKSSMVHIYAGEKAGDGSRGQRRERRLCEMRSRQKSKKVAPQSPPTQRETRAPAPSSAEAAPRLPPSPPRSPPSPPVSGPPSRASTKPSSSRPSSRQSSGGGSASPPGPKVQIEDKMWDASHSSSIEVQVTSQRAGREKSSPRAREVAKKPRPPTPPAEARHTARVKSTKDTTEIKKRTNAVLPKLGPATTSAERVMREAWEQYYREYDRYKEEMSVWESVQRKMRKQLARFMGGPSKPPAPPPLGGAPRASKTALAISGDPGVPADEGMHIRIGLPGRLAKGRRSVSGSRPMEEAPPCVQAMYAHPGPFGPLGAFGSPPPVRPGPYGPFGPRPMLMAPPPGSLGPPGPFGPRQPLHGMQPPRRSGSHITLNFM